MKRETAWPFDHTVSAFVSPALYLAFFLPKVGLPLFFRLASGFLNPALFRHARLSCREPLPQGLFRLAYLVVHNAVDFDFGDEGLVSHNAGLGFGYFVAQRFKPGVRA
ncbi:hypothetical protein SDC9_77094 [bioreactor metagenome]|uniref:Uncharacterized protein n=1 Tax=bioreactor metagenome TaxID=1076179 RepID=A0A644YX14_9ZZZZ